MDKKRIIILIAVVLILLIGGILVYRYLQVSKEEGEFLPDLTITSSGISFSPSQPTSEDKIVITAKVSNIGKKTAQDLLVQFFDDNPERQGKKIGERRIELIEAQQSKNVSVDWQATLGSHGIYILVDPENQIQEANEENNKAVVGVVVTLAVIESKALSEKEFLKERSIKELNNIAEDKGYDQVISASHSTYPQKTESVTGILFSEKEQKVGYLVKFDSQELNIYQNPFFIEVEGENIILTTKDGKIEIKDGELLVDLEEKYHSCSYGHCTLACFVYFVIFDDFWSDVVEETCKACKDVISTGDPEAIAFACTACASSFAGAGLGCAITCDNDPCWHCLTDDCGSKKWLGQLHCSGDDLMDIYEGYTCINPLQLSSYCEDVSRGGVKQHCKSIRYGPWQENYCSEDNRVLHDREVFKGYCDNSMSKCSTKLSRIETEEMVKCPEINCDDSNKKEAAWCKDGECTCCETDDDCFEDTETIMGPYCLPDEEILETTKTTKDYFCQVWDSPVRGKRCTATISHETLERKSCPGPKFEWGPWQCSPDGKKRIQDQIIYRYFCDAGECKTAEGEIWDTFSEECSGRCLDSECVGCITDNHCPDSYEEWGSWTCKNSTTLERQGTLYTYRCLESECHQQNEPKTEETSCSVGQKCQNGECIEKYALIVGENGKVIKYNSSSDYTVLTTPSGFSNHLYDLDFYADGALIVGNSSDGMVLKYDGTNLVSRFTGSFWGYRAVAFKPDGSYALIVSPNGVMKYDGQNFTTLSASIGGHGVAWKPDGSYALIVGSSGVYKYDGVQFSLVISPDEYYNVGLNGISWSPNGTYALIVGQTGTVLIYDGSFDSDEDLFYDLIGGELQDVAFKPDGSYAIIVGSEFSNQVTIEKYDGTNFSFISTETTDFYTGLSYYGVVWKTNSLALIVGERSTWDSDTGGYQGSTGEVLEYSNGVLSKVIEGFSGWLWGINWLDP